MAESGGPRSGLEAPRHSVTWENINFFHYWGRTRQGADRDFFFAFERIFLCYGSQIMAMPNTATRFAELSLCWSIQTCSQMIKI